MKLHPRHLEVIKAENDIHTSLTQAIARHKLTHAELTGILGRALLAWNRYAIRDEREEADKGVPK